MKTSEEVYNELRKKYTDEEIAESFVFNDDSLSAEENEAAEREFRELRLNQIQSLTEEQKLFGDLMQMKYSILDYFDGGKFDPAFSFASQLKKYSIIINRSNKSFAADLDLHYTKLSRIINGKDNPSIELMYRLEEHSKSELPAHYWWRIYSKELEHKIITDLEKRVQESKKVSNSINIRA
ncbi:hypothetical protein [Lewinella sp. IMCC34191]|uniref:hypothetical protein n=1 Tax=Lewinella sp. IMCC34191 TaxID=2259172 RepID=UPI000E255E06|nr:hypothetical protein [Lewinella sp. IMCC34191]